MAFGLRALGVACALCAALLAYDPRARAEVPVASAQPVYHTALPDGFTPLPHARAEVRAFGAPRPDGHPVVLLLRPLRGVVTRAGMSPQRVQSQAIAAMPGADVTVVSYETLGVRIPAALARLADGTVALIATVPVEPDAVQLTVTGARADEGYVREVAGRVLRSFRARSNWLTDAQVRDRAAAHALLGAAWGTLALYGLAWALRLRRARVRRAGLEAAWLVAVAAAFLLSALVLRGLPRGASAFDAWTPLAMGLVVLFNAGALALRRRPADAR